MTSFPIDHAFFSPLYGVAQKVCHFKTEAVSGCQITAMVMVNLKAANLSKNWLTTQEINKNSMFRSKALGLELELLLRELELTTNSRRRAFARNDEFLFRKTFILFLSFYDNIKHNK